MRQNEELLARLMNFLTEKYKNRLVLKGGMLLRLLNSQRATQDLDYLWIREKKRDIFAHELRETLEQLDGIAVTHLSVNSRGIFLDVQDHEKKQFAKIEINVVETLHCPIRPLTNARLVEPFSLPVHVVATMDLSEALAHKIAAILERNVIRDLYDAMILEPLTSFDKKTLQQRLAALEVNRSKPKKVSPAEAADRFRGKLEKLSEKAIREELGASLSAENLVGLEKIIRASLGRILHQLENL